MSYLDALQYFVLRLGTGSEIKKQIHRVCHCQTFDIVFYRRRASGIWKPAVSSCFHPFKSNFLHSLMRSMYNTQKTKI